MSFQDKVVIVTGASSGIGAATAKLFAKEKAKVVLVGRNIIKLNKVSEDIKKSTNTIPLVIKADVSNEDDAREIINKTVIHFKKIDILVNNAGIVNPAAVVSENYVKAFDTILNTNLRAVAVLTHAAAPHLIKTKGNIVNISSIVAVISNVTNGSAYSVSKAALDHLSRCLAVELAEHGVRVNIVNPGPTRTDMAINAGMTQEQSDALFEQSETKTPLKILSETEGIGEVILFLASDKGKSVTGASYFMDSGLSLNYTKD